jgi:YaiO family outer membrane protein
MKRIVCSIKFHNLPIMLAMPLVLSLATAFVRAQKTDQPQSQAQASTAVEVETLYEDLSGTYSSWKSVRLSFERKRNNRAFFGDFIQTSRFGETDNTLRGGMFLPLTRRFNLNVEVGGSPTHRILPIASTDASLSAKLNRGFVVTLGDRFSRYSQNNSNILHTSLEKYRGPFRAAYTLFVSKSTDTGFAASHLFQGNYYYGETPSSIGVGIAFGSELERIPSGLLETRVFSVNVGGNHSLTRRFALTYNVSFQRQGSLYDRRGASLGLRYQF